MMREPKTEPMPAPEPATPTVAAPAPMNLAAESMSALGAEVDSSWQPWARVRTEGQGQEDKEERRTRRSGGQEDRHLDGCRPPGEGDAGGEGEPGDGRHPGQV